MSIISGGLTARREQNRVEHGAKVMGPKRALAHRVDDILRIVVFVYSEISVGVALHASSAVARERTLRANPTVLMLASLLHRGDSQFERRALVDIGDFLCFRIVRPCDANRL